MIWERKSGEKLVEESDITFFYDFFVVDAYSLEVKVINTLFAHLAFVRTIPSFVIAAAFKYQFAPAVIDSQGKFFEDTAAYVQYVVFSVAIGSEGVGDKYQWLVTAERKDFNG